MGLNVHCWRLNRVRWCFNAAISKRCRSHKRLNQFSGEVNRQDREIFNPQQRSNYRKVYEGISDFSALCYLIRVELHFERIITLNIITFKMILIPMKPQLWDDAINVSINVHISRLSFGNESRAWRRGVTAATFNPRVLTSKSKSPTVYIKWSLNVLKLQKLSSKSDAEK